MILAAILILLAFGSGFVLRGTRAAVAGVTCNALAIFALIWAVFVHLPHALHDLPRPQSLPATEEQLRRILEVGGGIGLWLAILLLLLAIAFDILALEGNRRGRGGESAL